MNIQQIFTELKKIATSLDIEVRVERGKFYGGYCVLHTEKMIIINKSLPIEAQTSLLAQALLQFSNDFDDRYIKPMVRNYLEKEKQHLQRQLVSISSDYESSSTIIFPHLRDQQ